MEGGRFGFYRFKFRVMGIMTIGAEIVSPLPAEKISCPFSVDARLPVSIDGSMALTAEPVTLIETDKLCIVESQLVPVFRIVAIETPPHGFRMVEFDVCVFFFELPFLAVNLHAGMTVAARINSLGERWGRNRELLIGP